MRAKDTETPDPFLQLIFNEEQDFFEQESFFMDSIVVLIINFWISLGTTLELMKENKDTKGFKYSFIKYLVSLLLWLLILWRGTTKEKLYSKWMKRTIFISMLATAIVDIYALFYEYK